MMAGPAVRFDANIRSDRSHAAAGVQRAAPLLVVLVLMIGRGVALADPPFSILLGDPAYDVVARPTDLGAELWFDPQAHRLIELIAIELGRWTADDAQIDLFAGEFTAGGPFFRMDIIMDGLVNPPGPNELSNFDPFRFGAHPVYGFVEIDMDDDAESGGEIDAPEFRYLGNVARFGGLPGGDEFNDRPAENGGDFDGHFMTKPYVERHGEEFHLALLGGQFNAWDIVETAGDADLIFEADETWVISGDWFHRAHGFEPFSIASGGAVPGEYAPVSTVRFSHDSASDRTLLSLVFPLTNGGAAAQHGTSTEPMNHNPSDQASVNEGLRDLAISAEVIEMFPTGIPEETLILPWGDKSAGQFLDPTQWRVTALLGTCYSEAGGFFVWTDVYPNPIRGDVNRENGANGDDRQEIDYAISNHDGDDGIVDGRVVLADFADDFSIWDVNHNGVIDAIDVMLVSPPGDGDDDGDADLADFAELQRCMGESGATGECQLFDLNSDQVVDERDTAWFLQVVSGPSG